MLPINGTKSDTRVDQSKFDPPVPRPSLPSLWRESEPAVQAPALIALIDDDQTYRKELALNLIDENFDIVEFGDACGALDFFSAGRRCDVILLDWKMPPPSGIELLDRFRELGVQVPVVVLTAFCDEKDEAEALDRGAVDVLHKSRSPSILAKRLRIIANRAKPVYCRDVSSETLSCGILMVNVKMHRAYWKGERVPLTMTEFRVVRILASRPNEDVPYRELYDVVHGKEFKAGDGANGFHANVRSLIRHVRRKFRSIDGNFTAIETYPGFGYRWQSADARRDPNASKDAANASTAHAESIAPMSAKCKRVVMAA